MSKYKMEIDTGNSVRDINNLATAMTGYNKAVIATAKATKSNSTAQTEASTKMKEVSQTQKSINDSLKSQSKSTYYSGMLKELDQATVKLKTINNIIKQDQMARGARSQTGQFQKTQEMANQHELRWKASAKATRLLIKDLKDSITAEEKYISAKKAMLASERAELQKNINAEKTRFAVKRKAMRKLTAYTKNALTEEQQLQRHHRAMMVANTKSMGNKIFLANEQAAKKMTNAHKQAAGKVAAAWKHTAMVVKTYIVFRMMRAVINAVQESISTLTELEMKISEVRTISQQAQLPFEQWTKSVMELSDAFGQSATVVAEGVYQTLSNQVAEGEQAITFMNHALRASVAFVSDAATSVNLLTAGINAFELQSSDAEAVAASFFKTIELGRIRASEMSNSIGRLAPIANQIGVTMDEMNAALATMTIQGIKTTVANTQLRSIMMKLIKPTDTMTKLIKSWGYETGPAAVKAETFTGIIKRLNKEMEKGGLTRIGKLFGRERPITGIVALLREGGDAYAETLEKYENALADYRKAVEIGFESSGKKITIELNKVKNYFMKEFGQQIIRTAVAISKASGGLVNVVDTLMKSVTALAVVYASYKIVVLTTNVQMAIMNRLTSEAVAKNKLHALSIKAVTLARISSTAAVAALIYMYSRHVMAMAEVNALFDDTVDRADKINAMYTKKIALINAATKAWNKEADAIARFQRLKIAEENKKLNAQLTKTNDKIVKLSKTSVNAFKNVKKTLSGIVSKLTSEIGTLDGIIRKSENIVKRSQGGAATRTLLIDYIDNIGKVDEAWEKATQQLTNYKKGLQRNSKEQQSYNVRVKMLLALRKQTYQMALKEYKDGNVEQGRKKMQETISLTKHMLGYGMSRISILKNTINLIKKQNSEEVKHQKKMGDKRDGLEIEQKKVEKIIRKVDKLAERQKKLNKLAAASPDKAKNKEIKKESEVLGKKTQKLIKQLSKLDDKKAKEVAKIMKDDKLVLSIETLYENLKVNGTKLLLVNDKQAGLLEKIERKMTLKEKQDANQQQLKDVNALMKQEKAITEKNKEARVKNIDTSRVAGQQLAALDAKQLAGTSNLVSGSSEDVKRQSEGIDRLIRKDSGKAPEIEIKAAITLARKILKTLRDRTKETPGLKADLPDGFAGKIKGKVLEMFDKGIFEFGDYVKVGKDYTAVQIDRQTKIIIALDKMLRSGKALKGNDSGIAASKKRMEEAMPGSAEGARKMQAKEAKDEAARKVARKAAKEAKAIAKSSKETEKSAVNMNKQSTIKKSLYTHDHTVEDLLKQTNSFLASKAKVNDASLKGAFGGKDLKGKVKPQLIMFPAKEKKKQAEDNAKAKVKEETKPKVAKAKAKATEMVPRTGGEELLRQTNEALAKRAETMNNVAAGLFGNKMDPFTPKTMMLPPQVHQTMTPKQALEERMIIEKAERKRNKKRGKDIDKSLIRGLGSIAFPKGGNLGQGADLAFGRRTQNTVQGRAFAKPKAEGGHGEKPINLVLDGQVFAKLTQKSLDRRSKTMGSNLRVG